MATVRITEFTDPGCPWAFSAEPFRRRIQQETGVGRGSLYHFFPEGKTDMARAVLDQVGLPEVGPLGSVEIGPSASL